MATANLEFVLVDRQQRLSVDVSALKDVSVLVEIQRCHPLLHIPATPLLQRLKHINVTS